jgi:Tfp pilus assembly protein PilN
VITKLNLASRPFRNRTLPYLIALSLLALSAIGAVYGLVIRKNIQDQDKLASVQVAEIEKKLAELNNKGELVQQELPPGDRIRLVGAHKLVANRSFGWSRLFADLERVMPNNVSASRISVVNVFKDGNRIKAELDFAVLSREYPAVAQLIDNMNNSGAFKAELRSQDLQKTDRLKFSEFTLHLVYTPPYEAPGASTTDEPLMTQNQEASK